MPRKAATCPSALRSAKPKQPKRAAKPKAPKAPKEPVFRQQAGFGLTEVLEAAWAPPGTQVRYWSVNGRASYFLEPVPGAGLTMRLRAASTLEALQAVVQESPEAACA
jgi:hypothetical protein